MVARGLLDLGRHDFRSALTWGTRAAKANPDLPDALGVIFDAQVELGRYQAAVVTAQAMVDRKPAQGSLARVSYARELLGDPAGAVAAMVQAAPAGHRGPARRRPGRPRRRRGGGRPVPAGPGDRAAQPGQRGGRRPGAGPVRGRPAPAGPGRRPSAGPGPGPGGPG